jgi:hypothetical protein
MKKYCLEICLEDLSGLDNELYDCLAAKPSEIIPLVQYSFDTQKSYYVR